MTDINPDIDTIDAEPTTISLESGFEVNIERIKTRQLLRLMRILTRGAGAALGQLQFGGEQEDFVSSLLAAVVLAIPEAEDETIAFIRSMVTPAELVEKPRTKDDHAHNEELIQELDAEFFNPELEDIVAVLERVITLEAPHIMALGNRLAVLLKLQQTEATAKSSSATKKRASSSRRSVEA